MILPPDINSNNYFHPLDFKLLEEAESSENILFKTDSEFNHITVTENYLGRFLKFEDSYQAGILNHPLYKGNFPYLNYFLLAGLFNFDVRNILMLGMGTGKLAGDFKNLFPYLQKIDIVEIDPVVIETAKQYFNFKQEDNINIHLQDARVFVRNSNQKYDLIILDIFTASGLPYRFMTEEFLIETRNILTEEGILASNMFSTAELNSDRNKAFKSALKTYNSVFSNITIFPTLYGNHELYRVILKLKHELADPINIIIMASNNNLIPNIAELNERATEFRNLLNIDGIGNIDKYLQDICLESIDFDKASILKDCQEHNPELDL